DSSAAFVAEVKADGTGLVSVGYLSGKGAEKGYGIALDAVGNIYVTGSTTSPVHRPPRNGTSALLADHARPDAERDGLLPFSVVAADAEPAVFRRPLDATRLALLGDDLDDEWAVRCTQAHRSEDLGDRHWERDVRSPFADSTFWRSSRMAPGACRKGPCQC